MLSGESMKSSHLFLSMVEKSFPVDGVRAIALKLEGSEGNSSAGPLANSLITAVFQCFGTAEVVQTVLLCPLQTTAREGHCL